MLINVKTSSSRDGDDHGYVGLFRRMFLILQKIEIREVL